MVNLHSSISRHVSKTYEHLSFRGTSIPPDRDGRQTLKASHNGRGRDRAEPKQQSRSRAGPGGMKSFFHLYSSFQNSVMASSHCSPVLQPSGPLHGLTHAVPRVCHKSLCPHTCSSRVCHLTVRVGCLTVFILLSQVPMGFVWSSSWVSHPSLKLPCALTMLPPFFLSLFLIHPLNPLNKLFTEHS